jgi:hypothetical protein
MSPAAKKTAAAKPDSDTGAVLREAARRLDSSTRRLFLRRALGLGTLTLLSGCDVVDGVSAPMRHVSCWACFSPAHSRNNRTRASAR